MRGMAKLGGEDGKGGSSIDVLVGMRCMDRWVWFFNGVSEEISIGVCAILRMQYQSYAPLHF